MEFFVILVVSCKSLINITKNSNLDVAGVSGTSLTPVEPNNSPGNCFCLKHFELYNLIKSIFAWLLFDFVQLFLFSGTLGFHIFQHCLNLALKNQKIKIHFESIQISACFKCSMWFHVANVVFNTANRRNRKHLLNQMFLKISPYTNLKAMIETQLFMY